jgi:hypothetical protein
MALLLLLLGLIVSQALVLPALVAGQGNYRPGVSKLPPFACGVKSKPPLPAP